MSRSWIQSISGKKIECLPLVSPGGFVMPPMDVAIENVAHALAAKTRFNGHCKRFYSVAEHCVGGAARLPSAFKLPFLLHELGEVFLPDVPSPVKHFTQVKIPLGLSGEYEVISWATLEAFHIKAILDALGLASIEPMLSAAEVHAMDLSMLVAEAKALLHEPPEDWFTALGDVRPIAFTPACWDPGMAYRAFIDVFHHLVSP